MARVGRLIPDKTRSCSSQRRPARAFLLAKLPNGWPAMQIVGHYSSRADADADCEYWKLTDPHNGYLVIEKQ